MFRIGEHRKKWIMVKKYFVYEHCFLKCVIYSPIEQALPE